MFKNAPKADIVDNLSQKILITNIRLLFIPLSRFRQLFSFITRFS